MPALDYVRSYRTVSGELAQALHTYKKPGECLRSLNLGTGQRASFLVFHDIDFSYDKDCTLVSQQTSPRAVEHLEESLASQDVAHVLWQGKRRPDQHEKIRMHRCKVSTRGA